jgi:hypothetical protein
LIKSLLPFNHHFAVVGTALATLELTDTGSSVVHTVPSLAVGRILFFYNSSSAQTIAVTLGQTLYLESSD